MTEAVLAPIRQTIPASARAQPVSRSSRIPVSLFVIPVLVFILRFLPRPLNDASYAITLLYALTGRRQAVISLLMLNLLNMATHAFGMPPGLAVIYRFPVIGAAALSALVLHGGGISKTRCPGLLLGTGILCVPIIFHSAFISQMPVLSVLKALSFTLTILTLFAGWGGLSESERRLAETQLWGIVGGLTVLSAPMLLTPLGYLQGRMGFQGLITQAQTFGIMMGVFATFLWMLVITRQKVTVGLLFMASMATAYVYLSQARIGGLTLVAGLLAGVVIAPLIPQLHRFRILPQLRFSRVATMATLLGLAVIVTGGLLVTKITQYLVKYRSAEDVAGLSDVTDALYRARGGPLELMLASVKQRPLTGIGFGVPTEDGLSTPIVYDPIFNLPIMATAEKGVMSVAVIEELGIPLAIVVYLWFGWLFVLAARGGPIALAVFAASLAVNVAESCFFSPGGSGLFFLVTASMAVTANFYAARRAAGVIGSVAAR
jgi:hypothetical protein